VVPPPVQTAFEPFPLDGRHPTFLAVCSEVLGRPVPPPRLSRKAELGIACCVWTIFAWLVICYAKPPCFAVLWFILMLFLLLQAMAARASSWQLTPDGVEVDGVRFSPVDTILVIEPAGKSGGARRASLHRSGTCRTKVMSRLECTAILAVWQAAAQHVSNACGTS
jgi:hypothetical protein